jgi:CrcB protein
MKVFLIAFGGALGALLRYYISKFVNSTFSFSYIPWGTVIVNIVGAFFLSFLLFISLERLEISSGILLFFGTGFLGAFTTFSTFTYEALTLYIESPLRGITYFFANTVLGFLAAYFGMILGRGKVL